MKLTIVRIDRPQLVPRREPFPFLRDDRYPPLKCPRCKCVTRQPGMCGRCIEEAKE